MRPDEGRTRSPPTDGYFAEGGSVHSVVRGECPLPKSGSYLVRGDLESTSLKVYI